MVPQMLTTTTTLALVTSTCLQSTDLPRKLVTTLMMRRAQLRAPVHRWVVASSSLLQGLVTLNSSSLYPALLTADLNDLDLPTSTR